MLLARIRTFGECYDRTFLHGGLVASRGLRDSARQASCVDFIMKHGSLMLKIRKNGDVTSQRCQQPKFQTKISLRTQILRTST